MINELLLSNLVGSLTPRRVANIIKTYSSFLISAVTERPVVWGIPPVMTIEPTNICNLKCPLCTTGSGEMTRVNGKMTLDTFRALMDQFGDDIFFLLVYHQGEPYINGHFFDFVRAAKAKNIYVTTSTNGHYFTESNIRETIDSGLDSMIVSVDGVSQESYERYRVGGKLQKVLDGTRELMRIKKELRSRTPNVALQFLVMQHNESEIDQIRKIAREIGVDRLLIKNIEVRSEAEAKIWLPENEDYRRYDFDGENLTVKGSGKKSCLRPWTSTLVNWDGTFVPCCFDKNGEYPLGNIHQSANPDEIWQGEALKDFRAQLLRDRRSIDICRNCNQGFGSFLPESLLRRKAKSQPNPEPVNQGAYKE
jgi:radical SAM protein with 4Fe4S-binding SPASM domain